MLQVSIQVRYITDEILWRDVKENKLGISIKFAEQNIVHPLKSVGLFVLEEEYGY